jgi:hypothetical protein
MVRAGGYPTRKRTVPYDVRAFVFKRDGGKCRVCGAPGSEIDHLRDSNDPKDLRPNCKTCNGEAMAARVVRIDDPTIIEKIIAQNSRLAQRIAADQPLRVCDNEVECKTHGDASREQRKRRISIRELVDWFLHGIRRSDLRPRDGKALSHIPVE